MMNLARTKQMEALAALAPAERARLERLAEQAEMNAEDLWPDIWLYGFDDVEEGVAADLQADEDISAGRLIPNDEVMESARRILQSHGNRTHTALRGI